MSVAAMKTVPPMRHEGALLATLAAIQFTHIMDFMIMMPLGPQFMRTFSITPTQFGFLVSSYSFSAGAFALAAGFFMDRFDRKRALLTLYGGFALGTLCCALAPNYSTLLLARMIAGGFGGVAGSVVYAIVGDVIPLARRGRAMGVIMTSFSLASILGVPVGLALAGWLGWHAPFYLLAGVSVVILVSAWQILPSLPVHAHANAHAAWTRMRAILTHPNHHRAFTLMAVLTASGSLIYPFLSPSMVTNAGLPESSLPWLYVCGGAATFLSSHLFGQLTDRYGRLRMFTIITLLSIVPTLFVTHLGPVPVWGVLLITTFYMVFSSGRLVPSMAMVTASVEGRLRGGFMSVNSAVQQIAAALATSGASLLVANDRQGRITGYGSVGLISVGLVFAAVALARRLRETEPEESPAISPAEPNAEAIG